MSERPASWTEVSLYDICNPKQWSTIPQTAFVEEGYPVYGANGKIGYYTEFNHEKPTVLITCRGATCGTINVCEAKSYVTGNSMALDDLDESRANLNFLVYALRNRGLAKAITGTAQPQITRESLKAVSIAFPPLPGQRRIAEILDKADALRAKRRAALAQLDTLTQTVFIDMFGDPATNPKGWPRKCIGEIGEVITGNTPPRSNAAYYGVGIEWIKSDNINTPHYYLTRAEEGLSEAGKAVARTAPAGSLLVTCIAGSPDCIGNAAMTDREVAFNQQINALIPRHGDPHFLYAQILVAKRLIQEASTGGMKGMVSKSRFEKIGITYPPLELQHDFACRVQAIEKLKTSHRASLAEMDALFASLQHRAFRGEL